MDALERALTTSYEWCNVAHGAHHVEAGGGAFSCLRCDPKLEVRATAAQGMARPHWTGGRPPRD